MNEQPLVVETWPIWYTWPMRAAPVFPIVARIHSVDRTYIYRCGIEHKCGTTRRERRGSGATAAHSSLPSVECV
jgi:hypothetical protein